MSDQLKFLRIEDRGEPVAVFVIGLPDSGQPYEFGLAEPWLRYHIEQWELHGRDTSVEREALAALLKHKPAPSQPDAAAYDIATERILTEVFPRVGKWRERLRAKVRRIILEELVRHFRRNASEASKPPA